MAGYIGKSQGVTLLNVESNTVETADIQDGAVTAVKLGADVGLDVVNDTTPQLGGDLDTNGNDVNFSDNDKAQFGAGNDLQIYHDSVTNNSYIAESGIGDLVLQGNNTRLENTSGGYYLRGYNGGAVNLYHNNAVKLATTSTGMNVTGGAMASLGYSWNVYTENYGIGTPNLAGLQIYTANSDVIKFGHMTSGTTFTERMRIDSSGRVTKPYQPRFMANTGAGVTVSVANTSTIVFGSVVHNPQSLYNSSNGRFTAPVDGFYQFNAMMRFNSSGNSGTYLRVRPFKNGSHMEYLIGDSIGGSYMANQTYTYVTLAFAVNLVANDYIDLRQDNQGGISQTFANSGWSGYLVG